MGIGFNTGHRPVRAKNNSKYHVTPFIVYRPLKQGESVNTTTCGNPKAQFTKS